MTTRRSFIKTLAAATTTPAIANTTIAATNNDASQSIAILQSPELKDWTTNNTSGDWQNPVKTAHHYLQTTPSRLDAVDSITTTYHGTLETETPDSMQSLWRNIQGKTEDVDADHVLYLHHYAEGYDYSGWGGDRVGVIRNAEYLAPHPEYTTTGTGYRHFMISNLLHEAGHLLGLTHNDGRITETESEITATPMLSGYISERVDDINDRTIRFIHDYNTAPRSAGGRPTPTPA